jgi:hypothetical protein
MLLVGADTTKAVTWTISPTESDELQTHTIGAIIKFSKAGQYTVKASNSDETSNTLDMVGEWGSAIAIPNKGLVTICKIGKAYPVKFVKFIQRIKPLIEQSYSQHANPVSTTFFWYYKGRFTPIPVHTDDKGNINVIAPVQLSALMTKW